MLLEGVMVLSLGWATVQFAATVHTKLFKVNTKDAIQVNSQIRVTIKPVVIEAVDELEVIEVETVELAKMTVKELKSYAKELGIKGYSKLLKSDLQVVIIKELVRE